VTHASGSEGRPPDPTDRVVDASALAFSVGGKSADAAALRSRMSRIRTHAPHLIDAEVGNVLRRHERVGLLASVEAIDALRAARVLIDRRYAHGRALSEAAWALRHNLTFYDALYVALAAALHVPLITADGRLGAAPSLPCDVELV
jgi:predicted nucleic acid-binding protein